MLTSSVIDRGFKPLPVQTKDHNIGICCFSAKHASLRSKCKDWLALYPNHVSKWSNMSNRGLIHPSTLQELFGRHHYLVNRYRTSVSQILMPVMDIYFVFRNHNPDLSLFKTYHQVCNKSNTTGAKCGAETAYPLRAPEFIPGFCRVCVAQSLVFCVVFCRSLFFPFALFSFGHCVVYSSSIYGF